MANTEAVPAMRKCQVCGHARGDTLQFEGTPDKKGKVTDVTVTICRRCEGFYDQLDAKGKPSPEMETWRTAFGRTLEALGLT